ncbi:MAG: hypothetical protein ACRDD2_09980 [Sarcina sp.]
MENINFNKEEIITIIKENIKEIENEYLGLGEEEFYLPKPIMVKIDLLEEIERINFFEICDEMAKELIILKTGELNQINNLHSEIVNLAENKLNKYIIK